MTTKIKVNFQLRFLRRDSDNGIRSVEIGESLEHNELNILVYTKTSVQLTPLR